MDLNWPFLLSMALFYLAVLGIGLWASKKARREEKKCTGNMSEVAMVGGRNLNLFVSIFTMTATWVGGGYIVGCAEVTYNPKKGLVWAVGPIAFAANLILGALFFVKPIRAKQYVTLMDPFQQKYGNAVAAALFIPCIIADILWAACILGILGGTLSVVMNTSSYLSVGISAAVAIFYTLMGGLYSVAYTDVIQLIFMFFGLWFCVPFILTSPSSANITIAAVTNLYQEPWIGKLELEDAGCWIDELLLLSIGGVCYQAFYQRVLSSPSDVQAKITCYVGAVLCPILGLPSLIIGAVAASTNWNETSYGTPTPFERGQSGNILPIVFQHLCPLYVSVVGIGALAAAVMSSVDSVLLSAASQLGRNIFKNIVYKKASEKCTLVAIKASILLSGLLATALAMTADSVHLLWIFSADVLYSMMTPQVICIFYLPQSVNRFGAISGFILSLLLRTLVGEPLIKLPEVLPLPWDRMGEDGQRQHLFPFRTAIMFITIAVIVLASRFAVWLSGKRLLRRAHTNETDKNIHYMRALTKEEEKVQTE